MSASRRNSGGAPDVGPPDLGGQRLAGQVDADPDALAQREGHGVRVEGGELLLLPAVEAEPLAEVAVAVEEADADEGHAEVGGRLQVVAGQDAEAAGVLGDGLGDAELGREVGHLAQRAARRPALEPAGAGEVAVELVVDLGQVAQEAGVGGQRVEPGAGARGRGGGPGRGPRRPSRRGRPSGTGPGCARPTTSAGSWPAARGPSSGSGRRGRTLKLRSALITSHRSGGARRRVVAGRR